MSLGSRGIVERRETAERTRHRPVKPSTTEGQIEALSSVVAGDTVAAHVADADPHTQYQKESEKDAANGYLGSNANNRLGSTRLDMAATDRVVGRSTAGAGASEELVMTAAGRALVDDALASDQRTTLGLGALATKSSVGTGDLDNDAATYAKMQNVSATDKVLGRQTAGAGDVEEIACTAAGRALIDDAAASDQRTTLGLGTVATKNYTAPTSFTPALKFGGASVGLTYAQQIGYYVQIGDEVFYEIRIDLSAKGSSVGAATITGLPVANRNVANLYAGGNIFYHDQLTASGRASALHAPNATALDLYNLVSGGGAVALTDTAFVNLTQIWITGHYHV